MYIDYYFEELLKKFKSELEREENYINDGFFAPIKELNHLEISDEVYDLCECAWEEIKKEPSKEEYLDILKEEYEEYIRTPLLKLIDEVYYYSDNVIPLHNKEKKAIGIFLKPANECSEDFINEHQAIKTYRYHFQSIDEDVTCDYAIEAISEIWNKIVKYEIKKQEKRNTSNQIPQKGINLPEELNTDEAKKIFSKAVKAGLMQPLSNGSGYQWNRSNAMLAYLCGKIYCGDRIKQDMVSKEWMLKRGETFFPETALMSFFVNKERQAIKNLGQSRIQMQRPPKGYKDIDRLFDEAT